VNLVHAASLVHVVWWVRVECRDCGGFPDLMVRKDRRVSKVRRDHRELPVCGAQQVRREPKASKAKQARVAQRALPAPRDCRDCKACRGCKGQPVRRAVRDPLAHRAQRVRKGRLAPLG